MTRLVPQSSFWRAALVLLWIAAPIAGIATSSRYVEVCEQPPSGAAVCGTQHVGRFLLSRVKDALAEFEHMRLADKKPGPSALNTAGLMLLKEGKINEAVVLFQRNAEAFPDEALVFESLGEGLATQGKFREARTSYEKALKKDPTNASVSEILRHLP